MYWISILSTHWSLSSNLTIRIVDVVIIGIKVESHKSGGSGDDRNDGIIEVLSDRFENLALDKLVLREDEELIGPITLFPILSQLPTQMTGTDVGECIIFLSQDAELVTSPIVFPTG
jgi:hypothetical protein